MRTVIEGRRSRPVVVTAIAITVTLSASVLSLVIAPWQSSPGGKAAAPTNSLFGADGNLAMPAPKLADEIKLAANDDGSTQLTFSIEYSVAHRFDLHQGSTPVPGAKGPKADGAIVTVLVSPIMGRGGPVRLSPMFRQTLVDHQLTEATAKSPYSVRLSPAEPISP